MIDEDLRFVDTRLDEVRSETRTLEAKRGALLARRSEAMKRDMARWPIPVLHLEEAMSVWTRLACPEGSVRLSTIRPQKVQMVLTI